ncbi:ornithine--oxo-acid transaminase [Austwickia chelonae]|uniref:ornithine--oxo-acid transaminase n=1 Tax=Austwickia chelonae TaxID=100225 RepID=UPI001966D338|nr:ornithine--oxo-acid transaminase [Austwickia chelonae]
MAGDQTEARPLDSAQHIALTESHAAHNYHPLPVVIRSGEGVWVEDVEGRRYLDCLAGYSALNFGHGHPRLVARAVEQVQRLTLTSRAFYHDQLGPFVTDLAALAGKEYVLPMNSGAEAVETAVKIARRWGRRVKGVAEGAGVILTMDGNFHGRTTTIVSFSTDDTARADYGPFTEGFRGVPFGDIEALAAAITPDTVAVLLEPIQGESGVNIPPDGFLQAVRELCDTHGMLMIADEIQSGLGRTGTLFACDHEQVVPDLYLLGKALGGGIMPVSAVLADEDVMSVITPGSHGSTFGGNPLACAIAHEVVSILAEGEILSSAQERGRYLTDGLSTFVGNGLVGLRTRGLWAGVDIDPAVGTGREICERLMSAGVLAKETHGSTVRFAPPLTITEKELDLLLEALQGALK